ncbi:MAG TPA: glycosyltransferase family 9 protein [Planctomycetota bacterium]|nr:glycosyltransferase family 9 protein [Planctomycetota bacterium]
MSTAPILIVKTGALGDVLRTTSILPGLRERHPAAPLVWLTACGAADLVRSHPLLDEVIAIDLAASDAPATWECALRGRRFSWVISLDDERDLCRLAGGLESERLSGALEGSDGALTYTADVAPWFDMGLLSAHGKQAADRLKLINRESHAALFARMLEVAPGRSELVLPRASLERAAAFAGEHGLQEPRPLIGLNTGAGGRWTSKQLTVETTVALAAEIDRAREGRVLFLLLGGPEESERNARLASELAAGEHPLRVVDSGTENSLLDFAALIDLCDLVISSDSLALHMAVARRVPTVCFFAPTSAAEIELHGRGEKVVSTAPDVCSYRPDADRSTLTPERLYAAVERVLAAEDFDS